MGFYWHKSVDRSDITRLESEVERMLDLIQSLKEKYPNQEDSPWIPFFQDGVIFPDSIRVIRSGNTVLLEAKPKLANHIDLSNLHKQGKTRITTALLKVPFLTDVENEWRALHEVDLELMQPFPLPLDTFNKRDNSAPPWIICKVSIREGAYVRFHLSKAWSKCVIGTNEGGEILEGDSISRVSAWKLKGGCLDKVAVPMKVSYSWEGDTLRLNLPSWWKWFGREGGKRKKNPPIYTLSKSGMENEMVEGLLLNKKGTPHSRCSRKWGLYHHMKEIKGNKEEGGRQILEMLASTNNRLIGRRVALQKP